MKNLKKSTHTLQEHFQIEDISAYEKILISHLEFSTRTKNALELVNISKLTELLTCPLSELTTVKGFGKISMDNILSTLENFFSKTPKESDEFISDPTQQFEQCVMKILNLPNEIQTKKILPFIHAYNLYSGDKLADLEKNISPELLVAGFPEYLADNAYFDENLKDVINWLTTDLNELAEDIVFTVLKNEKQIAVVSGRAVGKSLEEIGHELNVTRERVRQLEAKILKTFMELCQPKSEKFLMVLYAMNNGQNVITFDDSKNFVGETATRIIFFFVSKMQEHNPAYSYEKSTSSILFLDGELTENIDEKSLMTELPEVIAYDAFYKTVEDFSRKKKYPFRLVMLKVSKIYQRTGKFFHRGKLTLTSQCEYILREFFKDGYKIADSNDYDKILHYLKELFGVDIKPSMRSIDSKIGYIGVLCGRGKYLHRDYIHVSAEIVNLIKDFIEKAERNVILFKEIYEALKKNFVGTQITNQYILQGIIKLNRCPYVMRRDYLTKDPDANLTEAFNNFVERMGEVTSQEIKREFISFTDANISLLIQRSPEVIKVGEGVFCHSSRLNLKPEDYERLEVFLHKVCDAAPVTSRYIFHLDLSPFADFMARNKIEDHNRLFGILRYMFVDKFQFSRPYISGKNLTSITNRTALLRYVEKKDKLKIQSVIDLCEKSEINYISKQNVVEMLMPEFVRIDEFYLMRRSVLNLTNDVVNKVVKVMQDAIKKNGGWQSTKVFSDYDLLPAFPVSWNDFFLESVMDLAKNAIVKLRTPINSSDFSSAVFVSDKFADYDFNTFLPEVLRERNKQKTFQTEEEIFDWLNEQGLCNTRIPKFLYTEGYLTLDENNRPVIK